MKLSPEYCAIHEAAHAVVAGRVGIHVIAVEIRPNDPTWGGLTYPFHGKHNTTRQSIIMQYAGMYATQRKFGMTKGNENDLRQIRELAESDRLVMELPAMQKEAQELVDNEWEAIEAVATELLKKR